MQILSNRIITASEYAEAYSSRYFFRVDTYEECRNALASYCIYIPQGYKFEDIPKLPANMNYVIVEFSTEDDYTQHEYRIMTVQKKYVARFLRNLEHMYDIDDEVEVLSS